jgi:hypothetical protein
MKRFIIVSATVLYLLAGQGICEEDPAKMVKYVDTIYLLNSDGSNLKAFNNVIVTSHKSDEQVIQFIYKGKEMNHKGNVLLKGVELRKTNKQIK